MLTFVTDPGAVAQSRATLEAALNAAAARDLSDVEREARERPDASIAELFGDWALMDYAALYLADLAPYPSLEQRLPRMPPPEVQRGWTGSSGASLMMQSVAFVERLRSAYETLTGRHLQSATALDYGAGWGRLTRLMLPYVPDGRLFACDAWERARRLFDGLGFPFRSDAVDEIPTSLPYRDGQFDLVWLFSVLTHLPADRADAVMRSLPRIVSPEGLVVITVRPPQRWRSEPVLAAAHDRDGFAHQPAGEGWGETSMSLDYIARRWPQWQVLGSERNLLDPLQNVVRLRRAPS
ncbi:MAG: hypothetical protein QOH61_105 [Chloroflexota bacterium]|jgi:SAM-dependent methyltransferase|nr:hypothetical protein [Chloroflexota bacterium]